MTYSDTKFWPTGHGAWEPPVEIMDHKVTIINESSNSIYAGSKYEVYLPYPKYRNIPEYTKKYRKFTGSNITGVLQNEIQIIIDTVDHYSVGNIETAKNNQTTVNYNVVLDDSEITDQFGYQMFTNGKCSVSTATGSINLLRVPAGVRFYITQDNIDEEFFSL